MLELYNLGIMEKDLKHISETNPEIKETTSEEIIKLINILKKIKCNNNVIKNIIITNPFYLTRLDTDIIELINKLDSIGISNLNYLFDANPYLLTKEAFEIEDFIKEKSKDYSLEEIIDMIDTNPFII